MNEWIIDSLHSVSLCPVASWLCCELDACCSQECAVLADYGTFSYAYYLRFRPVRDSIVFLAYENYIFQPLDIA